MKLQQHQIERAAQQALGLAVDHHVVEGYLLGLAIIDEMELDLSIMERPLLTPAEKSHLQKMQLSASLYCQGCGQCLASCPRALPIPDLMRAYMYVYGYRNLGEAQDLVLSLNLPDELCNDCSTCSVKCAAPPC